MSYAARFVRHHLLPEIGPAGQARVCSMAARVGGSGFAHEVAELYARASGFGRIEPGAVDEGELAPEPIVKTPAARAVCAGARAALAELRRVAREEVGA